MSRLLCYFLFSSLFVSGFDRGYSLRTPDCRRRRGDAQQLFIYYTIPSMTRLLHRDFWLKLPAYSACRPLLRQAGRQAGCRHWLGAAAASSLCTAAAASMAPAVLCSMRRETNLHSFVDAAMVVVVIVK
jgi:hypothetical protein